MSRPIDLVIDRLAQFKLRPNGQDRWRATCPTCGERNPNTLSIGIGDDDRVLLKCWKFGCSATSITAALGLQLSDLFPPKPDAGSGGSAIRRRRLLTASQALDLLDTEITVTRLCAGDMARGETLDDLTRARLLWAARRVGALRDEVNA